MRASTGQPQWAALRKTAISTIVNAQDFDDAQTSYNSDGQDVDDWRYFLLYLNVDSTGTGAHYIQFILQFSPDGGTNWYDLAEGEFAALFYEDVDTASGIKECFSGKCHGRDMRLRIVATNTSANLKFTVTAKLELWA